MSINLVKSNKKYRKSISNVKVYIQASFNNTIVSLTDFEGNVLSWATAGGQGFKGSRKSTPYAAGLASKSAIKKFKEKYVKDLKSTEIVKKISAEVYIKGPGSGSESAVRALGEFLNIEKITNVTGIPHNGCRPKKERRV
ncbi:MAG: 30S ribosomal protein S11 [Candidatus Azosocius agrarius]|nr:MAG: 30S ribosomal protein S11 [Gammaproteobacteria bacterium]